MKVTVRGRGSVSLTDRNFVAIGGQASVYVRDGVAYKVYTDPASMIPEAKFAALSTIADPNVIKPDSVLLDGKDAPVGYTMRAVEGSSLCQLFTRDFRNRFKVTRDHIVRLVADIREHVLHVHDKGILIVDLNELNLLVGQSFDTAFLIDVDSYQTPGYPATVIMPSVRDYSVSASQFSALSDWFSFAVLAFQLFVGCHPYKGTYKPFESVEPKERLERRMRQRLSAFRTDVSLPRCCYSVDDIPQAFRAWLVAELEKGERTEAPDPRMLAAAVVTALQQAPKLSSASLTVDEVFDFGGFQLVDYAELGGHQLAWVTDGKLDVAMFDRRVVYSCQSVAGDVRVGFTSKLCQPVAMWLPARWRHGEKAKLIDIGRKKRTDLEFRVVELNKSGDRFYVRNGSDVLEVEFSETSQSITAMATRRVANVLEMASKLHEGCAIQSMLGSAYVSLFPRARAGYQVRVPELDRVKIVDAKFDGSVLMCIVARGGQYDRLVFIFDAEFSNYQVRTVSDITPSGLNFVVLDSGVCVSVTEDEKIEAFSAKTMAFGVKVVEDPAIGNDMRLLKVGGRAGFERAGKLYQIGMR